MVDIHQMGSRFFDLKTTIGAQIMPGIHHVQDIRINMHYRNIGGVTRSPEPHVKANTPYVSIQKKDFTKKTKKGFYSSSQVIANG